MLDESSYLPSIPAKLPQGPWLIISPHPDDETFGLGGVLLLAAEQGIATDVLFLTSGDKGGDEGIAAIREQEALAVAQTLRIRDVSFWHLPDGSLLPCQSVIDRLADVIVSTKPACLFFPSPVEPHPDHRASSVIAWEAARKTGFTAEPWSYEISVQGPLNVLLDISSVVAQKREIMAMYASQMTQNHYIERILGLNQARAWSLPLEVSHAEAFHVWPKEDRPLNAMLLDFHAYKLGMDAVPQIAPTVSVIIRTKNRPDSLREAIVSVAAQTQRDIELVVVNDGGLDIENLVRQYAVGSICKIVYQSLQPGRGRVGAANAGLEQATGDYLLFLDDDDSISPGHLAKLSRLLESNPAVVLAYTDSKMVDMGGNDLGAFVGEFKPYQIMFGNRFPINAALFRRTAVEAGSCRFDQQFDLFEDWDFWLQLQAQGSFLHVPGMSATYRINPCGSGVQDVSGPRSIEYINIRNKWRGQWPDNWLVDALEAAEKSSVLEKELLRLEIEWNIARYKFIRLDRKVTELATAKDDLVAAKRELLSYKNDYEAVLKSRAWRLTEVPRALLGRLRQTKDRLTGRAVADQSSQAIPNDGFTAWVAVYDTLSAVQRQSMIAKIHAMREPPLISVAMPVYNAPIQFLKEAIESVRSQLYTHWELCIADDASTNGDVKTWLEHYAALDQRIRVVFRTENGQISKSSNTALGMAKGEFIALLNQDDILPEYALYYVAKAIQEHPDAGIIYSDEDKIDDQQNRSNPYFKPDWNYELFLGQNLISHLGVYRRCLLNDIGGFRVGFEGSQDHDLALRCVERLQARQIIHIPRILYHWRIHPDSAACGIDAKPYALTAGVRAVNEHLRRSCPGATAELIPQFNNYRVRFPIPDPAPRVCIVIPTHNQLCLVRPCIESILARTQYPNYEILVVDNNSDKADVLEYLKGLKQRNNIRVLRDGRPFNFSALNNAAVAQTEAEFVLLLNNDVTVISPDWLGEMVAVASRPGIGAVGARLWYPDDTLQHGGVLLGLNGVAGHMHLGLKNDNPGYCGRAGLMQSMSAVTAACLLVRRSVYLKVGGLDEHNLSVDFNDVDFCLKLRDAGFRNVWTPFAELYHYESASRGTDLTPAQIERFQNEATFMRKKWGQLLQADPSYNPNLTLKDTDFSPAEMPRIPPHG